ncbi:MAG: ABC transporter substrate-binding protein [Dehalococcoidia bacterium]
MTSGRAPGKRLTRRRFLGIAGVAMAAPLAACNGSASPRPNPAGTPGPETATPDPAASGTPRPTQEARAVAPTQGETLRMTGFVTSDRVYDPHKTQAGPFFGHQALVFSRLLAYSSQTEGTIAADIAAGLPEQPDPQTIVFTLRGNATWHNREPLFGRAVTAEDVKFSLERQINGDRSFVRRAGWLAIDKVEAQDPLHVVVKLKAPQANMVGAFAGVNAFIVPPEISSNGRTMDLDTQVGSGPFRWVEWDEGRFASVARNPNWYGGDGRPHLEGLTVLQPRDTREVEKGLRTKDLDVAVVGLPQAESLKNGIRGLQSTTFGHGLFFGMRFFTPQQPFNDPRFRTALSLGVDRRAMIDRFFAGSGEANPWVSWPLSRWTLPQTELAKLPGYRAGKEGREADIAEARALLAAYAAEQKYVLPDGSKVGVPAEIPLFVVDEAEVTLGMGSLMKAHLKESLGLNVAILPLKVETLIARMLTGEAPWTAGPDSGWVDLDDWLFPYFHSEGSKNSFALRDTDLDAQIAAQRAELDEAKRREIGFAIQRRLLQINAGVNFVSERVVVVAQSYVKGFPTDATDGFQHRFADCWIDRTDPAFRAR